jgi:hypothetical protein
VRRSPSLRMAGIAFRLVAIGDDVATAVAGTRLYLPADPLPPLSGSAAASPVVEVTNESCLCPRTAG